VIADFGAAQDLSARQQETGLFQHPESVGVFLFAP
jgi:hypothetical protein